MLPCELCELVANSTSSFTEHVMREHNKSVNFRYEKEYLSRPQKLYRKEKRNNQTNNFHIPLNRICKFWNRGMCKFDDYNCRYAHINIPKCKYQHRCERADCKFFHEQETQKYPFLGGQSRPNYQNGMGTSSAPHRVY